MFRILILCCVLSLAVGLISWAAPGTSDKSAKDQQATLEARAARRSFSGAPPTIPHEVYRKDNKECLHCHLEVRETPFGISNITPHPEFANCQQCHVGTQILNKDLVVPGVENSFVGWVDPSKGFRAHEFAPPTVPHTLLLRENCNSCHAVNHPIEQMRGLHPRRANCRQCHVQQNPEFLVPLESE